MERSVLDSRILMVDEAPIKAGVEHGEHRMKKGWFWPDPLSLEPPRPREPGADTTDRWFRGLRSRPLVELIFERLRQLSTSRVMLGDTLFTKAVNYALRRETQLKVFLEEPLLPMDTNALERQIRPIPLGRKNWLFCWTEIGAIYTGIIQSLICSCKLQGVNPFTYLVDVMLRLSSQPDTDLNSLIPRQWKLLHQDNPWRSDLVRNHAAR